MEPLKILRLTAENVKRIKVVDIKPDGSLVQITGANGSGKTSVLECIWWALSGTKAVAVKPIRDGEERASIRLDLGEIIVTRNFARRDDGTAATNLVVEAVSGARFPSPQKMLDDLLGALAFDPLAFSRAAAKEQLETLRGLVTIDVDVDALDAENATDYAERTDLNRRIKSVAERVKTLFDGVDPSVNVTLVDTSAMMRDMSQAAERNSSIIRKASERNEEDAAIERRKRHVVTIEEKIETLRAELREENQQLDDAISRKQSRSELPTTVDVNELREQIEEAQRSNSRATHQLDQREKHAEAKAQLQGLQDVVEKLEIDMADRTARKTAAIAAAKMPVPDLSFGDKMVTYKGLPFSQASAAEALRVSFAIAVAQNPTLRVVLIKDGSLLDETSLASVADMAAAAGVQVWVERVDTSGKIGIVMVDGEVAAVG